MGRYSGLTAKMAPFLNFFHHILYVRKAYILIFPSSYSRKNASAEFAIIIVEMAAEKEGLRRENESRTAGEK